MDEKHRILIVDDNNDNLKVAANILKSEEKTIWLAVNGKTGIEIAKVKKPDVILLDIQMPEMDGVEVCEILKSDIDTKDIPVIFMTARTDDESIMQAFKAGAVDYIIKPIKPCELTARVKTQLEIAKLIKDLRESINIKNTFFSIISHDLKGPIGGLASLTKVIYEEFDTLSMEEIKNMFHITTESAAKSYNLLTNLLEWAKSQTGKIECHPEMLDLSKIIEENIEIGKIAISKKSISVENRVKEKQTISADKDMINTIIRNLISNAVKFTTVNGKIEIGTEEDEDYKKIYVADNGLGMSDNIKEKLFKINEKVTSEGTEGEKGNGIGLNLCYEFIKKHNWEIEVESEQGKGSKFIIKIPKKFKI